MLECSRAPYGMHSLMDEQFLTPVTLGLAFVKRPVKRKMPDVSGPGSPSPQPAVA